MMVAEGTILGLTLLIRLRTVPSHCGRVKIIVTTLVRKVVAAWLEYVSLPALFFIYLFILLFIFCLFILQCFDAVGWAAGRASGL